MVRCVATRPSAISTLKSHSDAPYRLGHLYGKVRATRPSAISTLKSHSDAPYRLAKNFAVNCQLSTVNCQLFNT
jgi:hypothetical protein